MNISDKILQQLKKTGSRITKTRSLVISIFHKYHLPLTELQIREKLARHGAAVNKTTIYRELEHLKGKSIIQEVEFGDGKKRYELHAAAHHHHLVCTNCKRVEEINAQNDVSHIERKIRKEKRFIVTNHSLEFFGKCAACARK